MNSIIKKELKKMFNSLEGYIIAIVFLLTNGLMLWVLPYPAPNIFEGGFASLDNFFKLNSLVLLFLIPIITMGMISEEKKTNTLELLLTKPISPLSIIIGKFISCCILIITMIIPTIIYITCIYKLSDGKIDTGSIFCGYFGLLILCFTYISVGLFCSSLTKKQLIAFIVTLCILIIISIGLDFLIQIVSNIENKLIEDDYQKSYPILDFIQIILKKISLTENYKPFTIGMLDLKNVVYFISIGLMFLLISAENIKERR